MSETPGNIWLQIDDAAVVDAPLVANTGCIGIWR